MTAADQLAQEAKRLADEYGVEMSRFAFSIDRGARINESPAVRNAWSALHASIDAMADLIAELTKRAESAEALVEQYRVDAERLDWMSEHGLSMDAVADPDNLTVVFYGAHPCKQAYGRTLRDAIDTAIQQEKSNA